MRKAFKLSLVFGVMVLFFQNCGQPMSPESQNLILGKSLTPEEAGLEGKSLTSLEYLYYSGCADRDVGPGAACTMTFGQVRAQFSQSVRFESNELMIEAACAAYSAQYHLARVGDELQVRIFDVREVSRSCGSNPEEKLLLYRLSHAAKIKDQPSGDLLIETNQSSAVVFRPN